MQIAPPKINIKGKKKIIIEENIEEPIEQHKNKQKNQKKVIQVEDSESVEEIEIFKKKKPKKKKIIIHESSSSESEEQQEEEKDIKIPDKIMKSQKNRKSSISVNKEPLKNNNTPTSFFI